VIDTRLEGDERIVTFAWGTVVRELIIAIADETQRLAYAVIDGPMQTAFHHASMQVFDNGKGSSRLVWINDLLPHSAAKRARTMIERGAEHMKQTLESSR
jgi:hypothetical protein